MAALDERPPVTIRGTPSDHREAWPPASETRSWPRPIPPRWLPRASRCDAGPSAAGASRRLVHHPGRGVDAGRAPARSPARRAGRGYLRRSRHQTTHLAQLMANRGRIVAMDPNAARLAAADPGGRPARRRDRRGPTPAGWPRWRALERPVRPGARGRPVLEPRRAARNPDVKWNRERRNSAAWPRSSEASCGGSHAGPAPAGARLRQPVPRAGRERPDQCGHSRWPPGWRLDPPADSRCPPTPPIHPLPAPGPRNRTGSPRSAWPAWPVLTGRQARALCGPRGFRVRSHHEDRAGASCPAELAPWGRRSRGWRRPGPTSSTSTSWTAIVPTSPSAPGHRVDPEADPAAARRPPDDREPDAGWRPT